MALIEHAYHYSLHTKYNRTEIGTSDTSVIEHLKKTPPPWRSNQPTLSNRPVPTVTDRELNLNIAIQASSVMLYIHRNTTYGHDASGTRDSAQGCRGRRARSPSEAECRQSCPSGPHRTPSDTSLPRKKTPTPFSCRPHLDRLWNLLMPSDPHLALGTCYCPANTHCNCIRHEWSLSQIHSRTDLVERHSHHHFVVPVFHSHLKFHWRLILCFPSLCLENRGTFIYRK